MPTLLWFGGLEKCAVEDLFCKLLWVGGALSCCTCFVLPVFLVGVFAFPSDFLPCDSEVARQL